MWFLILFCCSLIGFYLTLTPTFKELSRKTKKALPFTKGKPFNCAFCTTFWLTFFTYAYFQQGWLDLILVPLAASVLAFITEHNMNR